MHAEIKNTSSCPSLLSVRNLSVSFRMYDENGSHSMACHRDTEVLSDLSLDVGYGELVAVVGASGSGKTLLADAILGMFDANEDAYGQIVFDGCVCSAADVARLRGHAIAYVPQGVDALDPLMRVGRQVRGVVQPYSGESRRAAAIRAKKRQRELFVRYGLDPAVERMYPHELSGGMARRVLLCCALAGQPQLLVADEPTPGLDAERAAQAMCDLRAFADEGGGVLLITHDIALALAYADRIAVFSNGTVVEEVDAARFEEPGALQHPFSQALLRAMPEHGMHEDMAMERLA